MTETKKYQVFQIKVFQITNGTPNQYRYVVINEGGGDSAIVEADLAEGEEIDTISDLESVLGGRVKVICG